MGDLTVGLGLWHEDVQRIIDGFAYGRNPVLREHSAERPDELYWPSALELQVGSLDVFTARRHGRVRFSPDGFSAGASRAFFSKLLSGWEGGRPFDFQDINHLTAEGAVHKTLDWVRSKPYRGVHSSDGVYARELTTVIPCDLTSPNRDLRRLALGKYQGLMNLAHAVEATSFVMHPIPIIETEHGWLGGLLSLPRRKERKDRFFESLHELLVYHRDQGFAFPMLIENLEFPKFPATVEECVEMLERAKEVAYAVGGSPGVVGLCFDVQHMRHSYKIVNEPQNREQYASVQSYVEGLLPGFQHAERPFFGTTYVEQWQKAMEGRPPDLGKVMLERLGSEIRAVHLAGNYETRNAASMDFIDETQGSIPYLARGDKCHPKMLHIRRVISSLIHFGVKAPVIIEDQSKGGMKAHLASAAAVEKYINEEGSTRRYGRRGHHMASRSL